MRTLNAASGNMDDTDCYQAVPAGRDAVFWRFDRLNDPRQGLLADHACGVQHYVN